MSQILSSRSLLTFFVTAIFLISSTMSSPALHAVGVDQLQLQDPVQEAQARDLFKKYRCLVCQNQSIEDSDAELAADLRAIIREQITAGSSPEDIQTFLVSRYGDWVLLTPRFSGFTIFLWVFPFLLLGLGLIATFVFLLKRKPEMKKTPEVISDEDEKAIREFRK